MFVVAYALARLGKQAEGHRDAPPEFLGAETWGETYDLFHSRLHHGRSPKTFRNTLKNARDAFDAHVTSRRTGWRMKNGRPPEPTGMIKATLEAWKARSDDDLKAEVLRILDSPVSKVAVGEDWIAVRKRIVRTTIQTVNQSGKEQKRLLKGKELRCADLNATIDALLATQGQCCAQTRVPFREADPELRASLDRIDSDGHYSDGTMEDGVHNLQLVTHFYNIAKSTRSDAEMRHLLMTHAEGLQSVLASASIA